MELPDFSTNRNHTAAQLRRAGAVLLLLGLLLTTIGGAILAFALGVPVPAFLIPDSTYRIETSTNPEPPPIGALIFLSYITAIGIAFSAAGMWQILFGKVNGRLLRTALILAVLFLVAGVVASALLGRRIGTFHG